MKVLVLLALVACAAAQTKLWPYSTPASTVKTTDITPSIIPYAAVPWTQGVFPYTYPIVAAADPAVRAKRSADAEADPQMLYSSALGYPYAGYPWGYNTYPYTWPHGVNPIVKPAKPAEATRAKRSADAEADPQLIYSSATTYPYAGYPWTYNTYPYTLPYGINPIVKPAKPAEEARAKRSADADPQLILNTPVSYPFGAYPYSYNIDAGTGFITPYSGIHSYSTPVVTNTKVQLQ